MCPQQHSSSYTAAGRLATRLWARGITTTYSCNNFGDLSGVNYDDGATRAGFVP
jgi:YD repeat-containing protein